MKITLLTGKTFDIKEQLGFDIKINSSARAKKLSLRIDSKERIPVLTIPKYCSQKRAIEFVKQNQGWIETNLNKIPESRSFEDNETISLFGEEVTIKHNPSLRSGVYLEENVMYVSGEKEFLSRRVKDFIKKEAQKRFLALSREKAAEINCTVNNVAIKDTKSRWGSCSTNNNINYNWRIALAPKETIEYLICHEVSHLKHLDHSRAFWNCVKELYPDYLSGQNWLKKHSKNLYLYS